MLQVPSREIDKSESRFWTHWNRETKQVRVWRCLFSTRDDADSVSVPSSSSLWIKKVGRSQSEMFGPVLCSSNKNSCVFFFFLPLVFPSVPFQNGEASASAWRTDSSCYHQAPTSSDDWPQHSTAH